MHSRDPSPLTPAARVTTLPTPSLIPSTIAKHHHRLHHPHHRHHHRGPSHAATQPQSGSGASVVYTADSDTLAGVKTSEESEGGGGGGAKDEKERKAWAVLRVKKVDRGLGDNYLRLRLQSLTSLSTTTTRRLDYTYYSLLSHASAISTLLTSLSALSTTTLPNLSLSLLSTHQAQLSNLENTIHSRQEQVKELQARLAASRAKVGKLGNRLGKVRVWIEGVERGEREVGGRVRTRLRVLAGVTVGVLVLLVILQSWRICIFRGGDGRLGRNGDLFAGRVSGDGGVGGGGDVMRKRWNKMNLGETEVSAMMAQEKNVGGSGSGSGSVLLTPKGVWGQRDDNAGARGRMRMRLNDIRLGGAAERYAISSRVKLGSSSSSSSTHSAALTPSAVNWQGARGKDEKEDEDEDEDPRLRVFDEL